MRRVWYTGWLIALIVLSGGEKSGLPSIVLGASLSMPRPLLVQSPDSIRIAPRLLTRLNAAAAGDSLAIWVFFTDKGIQDERSYRMAVRAYEQTLTEHARQRRAQRGGAELIDFDDLPVSEAYVRQVVAVGARLRGRSRWLNGVSVTATPEVIRQIASLSFVRSVSLLTVYRRPVERPVHDIQPRTLAPVEAHRLSYGGSLTQLAQMRVPDLHDLGLSGHGVIIGILDTGFRLTHVAFDSLRARVIAQHDFIHGDGNTADDRSPDQPGQHDHGTETLSTIGGYAPGSLIGPAYGARFILAKTEEVSFEQRIEEDWWVQGIEWADSLGADVISSSLGYNDWYQYSDMDGKTAVTTKAATLAVQRGIVVVNAMGNEGQSLWQKMIAPADAESVLSIGAVDSTGVRAPFSSLGPTFDRRIKPDIVAMGMAVRVADPDSPDRFVRLNGTSFSTPLVAGVAALLLEAYPTWTPGQVKAALKATASQSSTPDTLRGAGVVNALAALLTGAKVRILDFTASNDSTGVLLTWTTSLEINIQGWKLTRQTGPDSGIRLLTPTPIPGGGPGVSGGPRTYLFIDTTAVAGVTYEYVLEAVSTHGTTTAEPARSGSITFSPSGSSNLPPFALHQNYPNPFNPGTKIAFDLHSAVRVTLAIYNVLGQRVRVLIDSPMGVGHHIKLWDGTDDAGRALASGVYFYRLTAGAFIATKKMLLIR